MCKGSSNALLTEGGGGLGRLPLTVRVPGRWNCHLGLSVREIQAVKGWLSRIVPHEPACLSLEKPLIRTFTMTPARLCRPRIVSILEYTSLHLVNMPSGPYKPTISGLDLKRLAKYALAIGLTATLAGCTSEKAEALLTSVKAFAASSSEAIDSYESLFQDYRNIGFGSPDQKFNGAYAAIAKYGVTDVTSDYNNAVRSISSLKPFESGNAEVRSNFDELRASYSLLADSYASLPQGSLLGATYVPCGQLVVSKLTQQLVNFANDIDIKPLYPLEARQNYEAFVALASQGKKELAKQKFDNFYSKIHDYENKQTEAKRKTIIAVEQGRRLYNLLGSYSSVTLSNLLGVVDSGFMLANSLRGVNLSAASSQLASVQREMDGSDAWKRVKELPLGSISSCSINLK